MDYKELKNTILKIKTTQFINEYEFLQTQIDTCRYINTFHDDHFLITMIGQVTSSTKESFSSVIQEIIKYIDKKIQSSSNIFIEEIHECYLKNILPGEFWYEKEDIHYDRRFNSFLDYIKKYCTYEEGKSKLDFVNHICDISNYFLLGIHRKTHKEKPRIIIYFKCNYCGNTNSGKGCSCNYELRLYFDTDGKLNEYVELPLGEIKHKHSLSVDKMFEDSSNMTYNQREKMREEILRVGKRQYKIEHKTRVKSKYINRIFDNNKSENKRDKLFVESIKFNDGNFMVIKNCFDDGSLHSVLYVNSLVAQKGYSRYLWACDDSAQTNKYNKRLFVIMTKDDFGYSQVIAFGTLFDGSTTSFDYLLEPLKEILPYQPLIIMSDRSKSQLNSLHKNFPESKTVFCQVHLFRTLCKYFKNDHPIIKSYISHIRGNLNKYQLMEIWKEYTGESSENEEYYQSEEEDYEFNDENIEDSSNELFYNSYEYECSCDTGNETVESLKEEIRQLKEKKGIGCIVELVNQIDNWCLETCIDLSLYKNNTTNICEGFFGSLKIRLKNKKVMLYHLIEEIKEMCKDNETKQYTIEIPSTIINREDSRYKCLTPLSKIIIMEQYNLAMSDKYKEGNKGCLSCKIREKGLNYWYPCCHYFKLLYQNNIYIKYEDLPERCYIARSVTLKAIDKSFHNINKPPNICILNNISYIKVYHNNNSIPRRNVEIRKKRIKQLIQNTHGFDSFKSMINSSYLNGITIVHGYLAKTEIDLSLIIPPESSSKKQQNSNDDSLKRIKGNEELLEEIPKYDIIDDDNYIDEENDEINIYEKEILETYNISRECYNRINSLEIINNNYIISPIIIDSLSCGSYSDFKDSVPDKFGESKLILPIKFNNFWNIVIVNPSINYKKKTCRNCIIVVSHLNKYIDSFIEGKLKRLLNLRYKRQFNDLMHVKIKNKEKYFTGDEEFIEAFQRVCESSLENEQVILKIFQKNLK